MTIKIPQRKPKVHPDFCDCEKCSPPAQTVSTETNYAIVFYIETIAQDEEKLMALAPDFQPDSRLKDPVKIEENLAKQRSQYIERAALDWKTAEIALIGVGDGATYNPIHGTEKEILAQFFLIISAMIKSGVAIGGHNVKGFDWPMIINRARILRVPVPEGILSFWNGRPRWNELFFDTLDIFSFGDRQRIEGCSVDAIAKLLGIPGKTGHGSEFGVMWKTNKDIGIRYNQDDIRIEIEIAKVCGFNFKQSK